MVIPKGKFQLIRLFAAVYADVVSAKYDYRRMMRVSMMDMADIRDAVVHTKGRDGTRGIWPLGPKPPPGTGRRLWHAALRPVLRRGSALSPAEEAMGGQMVREIAWGLRPGAAALFVLVHGADLMSIQGEIVGAQAHMVMPAKLDDRDYLLADLPGNGMDHELAAVVAAGSNRRC
jgi:hypothetical protein